MVSTSTHAYHEKNSGISGRRFFIRTGCHKPVLYLRLLFEIKCIGQLQRITDFVRAQFGEGWASECTAGILRNGCWVAVKEKQVVGFACYYPSARDFVSV